MSALGPCLFDAALLELTWMTRLILLRVHFSRFFSSLFNSMFLSGTDLVLLAPPDLFTLYTTYA